MNLLIFTGRVLSAKFHNLVFLFNLNSKLFACLFPIVQTSYACIMVIIVHQIVLFN